MQTKFIIIASAIIGVSGVYTWFGHNPSGLIFFVVGILFYLVAFLSKDKKDQQIEEMHTVIIRNSTDISFQEETKSIDGNQNRILSIFMNTTDPFISASRVIELSPFGFHETKDILHSLKLFEFVGSRQ